VIELPANTCVVQVEIERTAQPQSSVVSLPGRPTEMAIGVACGDSDATPAVRAGPKQTTDVGRRSVVRAAMTLLAMGPHWPGHSPAREETKVPPVCRRFPPSAGWNLEGFARSRLPMVGYHAVKWRGGGQATTVHPSNVRRADEVVGTVLSVTPDFDLSRPTVVLDECAS